MENSKNIFLKYSLKKISENLSLRKFQAIQYSLLAAAFDPTL